MSDKRYAVGVEICHILTQERASVLANMIRDRLDDMDEDVFICITEYEQVRHRKSMVNKALEMLEEKK